MQKNIFNTKDLGLLIRKARKKQGLTQADLAGISGLGTRFIGEVENGKNTAHIGKVIQLASSLGLVISVGCDWMED
ncbi:helix-turn-helix transcriptional regulator [Francisella tularensis]|uniref:helix-turn-helix transcriptional regulator n=1 Tax=Francisella tularensis TaxID=263 RepID=UPI001C0E9CCB|nr:helix-turn-helix transcriptional regulator [Francisella tularensis]MBK2110172.1 helix-turn-helix transcriptional regulator [Francisella tularensis subsp. novicida FSC595]